MPTHRVVATAAAAAWLLAGPAVAQAQTTATQSFAPTGAEQTFRVPAGVRSVDLVLTGGNGAQAFGVAGGAGGSPATVETSLPVTPGQLLYVEVGGDGTAGGFNTAGPGGFNGGGNGVVGAGGGGGGSDIRTAPRAANGSLNSRLAVAAGGGGGGEYGFLNGFTFAGGAGGAAASDGAKGTNNGGSVVGGAGGGGATPGAGGAVGAGGAGPGGAGHDGTAGALGLGGTGGAPGLNSAVGGGGGGGGGYFGGGGGGGGGCCQAGGGGGGGGSSFVIAGAAGLTRAVTTGSAAVSITYPIPTATLSTGSLAFGATTAPQTVTIANQGSAPLAVSGLSFGGDDPGDFFVGSHTCGGEIAPGSSCRATIHFAPQGAGDRAATLLISSNAGAAPAVVALTGSAAPIALPAPVQGPAGPAGPAGPQGPAGKVQLVTCTTKTQVVKRKRVKRTTCTGKLASGPVKTASGRAARATLARGKVVYATGTAVRRGARTQLVLQPARTLVAGRYTLRLGRTRVAVTIR